MYFDNNSPRYSMALALGRRSSGRITQMARSRARRAVVAFAACTNASVRLPRNGTGYQGMGLVVHKPRFQLPPLSR